MTDHEALDVTTWFDRMGRFVAGLNDGDANADRHIRKAYHLHCLAPDALKPMMAAPVDEAQLEAMLECGAFESAVTSLIGRAGRVTVANEGQHSGIEVRMRVEPNSADESPRPDSWSMAMLEAWAVSFLRLRPVAH